VVSTWLVRPFLNDPSIEGAKKWQGLYKAVAFATNSKELEQPNSHEMMWVMLLFVEHMIFVVKAYLQISINLNLDDVYDHHVVVTKTLDYAANAKADADKQK